MTQVNTYIDALIKREGGYSDHPADKGGPTIYGITEQVARAYGYHGRMQDMPHAVAQQIYLERYWEAPGFNKVSEYSAAVAEELLDTGVNMGQGIAGQFLQRALNALNQEASTYPDVIVDGIIGRMTLAALRAYLGIRGKDGHLVLMRALNAQQGTRYLEIAENCKRNEAFVHGWFLNRII